MPRILGEPPPDLVLGGGPDYVQDLALECQRTAEQDQAVVHERVHDAPMLLELLLFTQTT